jgi:two-component system phosphate regulon response regulator PhoB
MSLTIGRPYRIVLADDDADLRELVAMRLRASGYDVVERNNGPAALAAIRQEVPDLAILDVVMPGISGFEICRRLAEQPPPAPLPVIMLTSMAGSDSVSAGLAAGASLYHTKPVDIPRLLADISTFLPPR